MEYSLYKLSFTTPLHIGKSSGGNSLDDGQMTIHTDTLFSALCCEAAKDGRVNEFVKYFEDGMMTISDALPYYKDELFLPRPILYAGNKKYEGNSSLKKKLKSVEFIPLSSFEKYIEGINRSETEPDDLDYVFGRMFVNTRAAIKGNTASMPYHTASWRFMKECGLYLILCYKKDEAAACFDKLLINLGLSGVGGKTSSGWGKFNAEKCQVPEELISLMEDRTAGYQMLLGTALPIDSELEEAIDSGWYTLVRRGGFICSIDYAPGQLKKKTIYMLAPGSCLRRRFMGGMFDLSDNGAHPVWRCGNTLFAGVNI